ncbi:hypothetical protein [Butyrivibrio sp. MC2013]|uniref:hypothetical protein n=1 Tax=Butyrivibrio sp. MC2013 TaxID=1280686 RepID=UPI0004087E18|nr:hypothetical protein [Butyrivibrio sp. MC2013]
MNKIKAAAWSFAMTVLALLLIIALLVVYVDPFFHYHEPLAGFPYFIDNQLSQNPGMAARMNYDSCIIGSSMTVNFNTNDFREELGLDTIKLSYSGALPRDDKNILAIVFDKDSLSYGRNGIKAVFMAMDPIVMTADTDATKYPLPEYLYDDNYINDIKYLFNKDVLFRYILKPFVQKQGSDLATIYYSWWTPEYYDESWVMHNYQPAKEADEETPEDAYIERTLANMETNILPFIRDNPDTRFYIFLPAYSVLHWYDVSKERHLDATLAQVAYIGEMLMEYDNVELYDFMTDEETVTNINNYADIIHFRPEYNSYMVSCFASGERRLEKGDMERVCNDMRQIISGYDYQALFERNP